MHNDGAFRPALHNHPITTTRMASKPLSRLLPRVRRSPFHQPLQFSRPSTQHPRHHSTTGTSVDPTEISHFDGLASTWWDPHGSSRLLHLMNPIRLQFIQSCLLRGSPIPPTPAARGVDSVGADPIEQVQGRGAKGLRYLDVGCGGGILAEALARLKSTESVLGVDASTEVLKVAESHRRTDPELVGRLRYLNTTIEELGGALAKGEGGGEAAQFDIVTLMEVIEHVPHPHTFLDSVMTHVKPGGWLVLSTIARTWTSYLITNLIAEDILNIVPRGTHDWNKYINADELRTFFKGKPGWGSDGGMVVMGCAYIPGFGWKEVKGGENVGNYFFGVKRNVKA